MLKSKKLWFGVCAAVLVIGGALFSLKSWSLFAGPINALNVDLDRPYAYVSTPSLSQLPRDLVKAPVLREVLTEDLAFYYEEHEDRLGLRGAFKRIAFEHELSFSDKLLELALDEPAEVAWWVDSKGAPRYWLVAMTRGVIARTLQQAGTAAASDQQFSLIAEVRIQGKDVPFYALKLSSRRTLALAARGDRVLVLSDPGLVFNTQRQADKDALKLVAQLLSDDAQSQAVYRRSFGLEESVGKGHTLVADARLLSFGYQQFFPGIKALRFDLAAGGGALQTQLRTAAASLPTGAADQRLWSGLPANAAACTLLPADWSQAKTLIDNAQSRTGSKPDKAAWSALVTQLEGPAAVCWYARSQLHTPLFVARTKAAADHGQALQALAQWLLPGGANAVATTRKGAQLWQVEVKAPWGAHSGGETYKPTLAQQGEWISFSPDDALVELALDAQAQRYPNVNEMAAAVSAAAVSAAPPPSIALLTPKQIADLAQRETFELLSPSQQVFRRAAEHHLVPRLDALRKLPAARAVPRGVPDANGWVAIDWQALDAAATAASTAASEPTQTAASR